MGDSLQAISCKFNYIPRPAILYPHQRRKACLLLVSRSPNRTGLESQPILSYVRYRRTADEESLTRMMGVAQAIISIHDEDGDKLQ